MSESSSSGSHAGGLITTVGLRLIELSGELMVRPVFFGEVIKRFEMINGIA